MKQKKILITRFGGIGDMAPVSVIGEQLKKRGYHVTFAVREDGPHMRIADLFHKHPAFDRVIDLAQVGPWNSRCIKTQVGFCSINSIYHEFDRVIDLMYCIEGNSTSPVKRNDIESGWETSRNSNWVNWYDLHLAWANIDPTSVPNDEKRPKFYLDDSEKEAFAKFREGYSHLITIQTSASSLSRTWYQAKQLPEMIVKKYPDALVAYWDAKNNFWVLFSKNGPSRLSCPKGVSPIRFSMGLIASSDAYIGADTGFTHVAEGFEIPHIALYSTVPSWTRAKYYKFQTPIDPGEKNPEFYTFNLGLGDPLRTQEGIDGLTEREKLVKKLHEEKKTAEQAMAVLNVDANGVDLELQALKAKLASFEHLQSKALASITAEQVFSELEKLIHV